MIRIFLAFLTILCAVSVSEAHACSCVRATPESGQKLIDESFFIGTVKVTGMEHVKDMFSEKVVLESVQPYTKNFDGALSADNQPAQQSCGYGPMEEGQVYEVIILKREDSSYLVGGICDALMPEQWEELRANAAEQQDVQP